jgi:hypothetical protein
MKVVQLIESMSIDLCVNGVGEWNALGPRSHHEELWRRDATRTNEPDVGRRKVWRLRGLLL